MTQLELGLEAKRKGKAKAAKRHGEALEFARDIAYKLARTYGTVSSDHVQAYMKTYGREGDLKNAAGSIFDDERFVPTGQFVPSTRPSRHGGIIRVWRLK